MVSGKISIKINEKQNLFLSKRTFKVLTRAKDPDPDPQKYPDPRIRIQGAKTAKKPLILTLKTQI